MSTTDFDAVDYFRAAFLYPNPYPYYEYLRKHGPVWREPHRGVVMVTGYPEAVSVYRDTERFSNCNAVAGPFAAWPVPLEGDDVSDVIERHRDGLAFSDQLPTFDPPKHTAHRGLLARLITPKRLKENEEFMWRLADRQIDEILDRGECDFVAEFANPFTSLVVADLLGVPEGDREEFRQEFRSRKRRDHHPAGGTEEGMVAHKPLEFLYERFTRYVEERRRDPREDVMTGLATATFPDGSLPAVHEVALIAANLFTAGQETTVRLLGAMFQRIGERPDLQEVLRRERERIPSFVEETLRLETPLQSTFRLSRVPVTIGDLPFPAGTTVMLLPAAANRDPREFPHPDEFRLDRPNGRQHLAFGHAVHSCAGAPLARAEARVATERLLDRMRDIRISEKAHGPAGARRYEYLRTYMIRGLEYLQLDFTPA